ncbi:MAG: MBL fold metallo-hydrolase [Cytophagales bacterium]|nr:MBL fold metallo-hydrolase [Cytophagales bacterium]
MEITRLNADSSWKIRMGNHTLLVDPWLFGSQVDGFSWFSEQWHVQPSVPINDLGEFDGILISHPFTDHCHKETLLSLPPSKPVWATPGAAKKIRSWKHFHLVYTLSNLHKTSSGTLEFQYISTESWIDPVHHAILLKDHEKGETLFYAPHGFKTKDETAKFAPVDVLITTTIQYNLPFWLGGTINLGKQNALDLIQTLHPKHVIYTHNEKKRAKGLISKLAKPDWDEHLNTKIDIQIHYPELAKPVSLT